MANIRAVKGMNDILPDEMPKWHHVEGKFRALCERYGFEEVRTPIVEPTDLFVRSIGEATDIVEKEMYTFIDKGDDSLTLRPEGTASSVRAYVEHTVGARQPVTKWYYVGPMYRRERPAKGRYRQFYQAGVEVYGDPGPFVDAEIIDMVVGFVKDLGIEDVEVLVNSLGSGETRTRYRDALVEYLEPRKHELSEESQRRLLLNPLRILDSKDPKDAAIAGGAPSILEFLSDEDRVHWDGLRATLDALGTPYRVDARLVRGLDYYSRTLFEVRGRTGLGAQNAILGGGRYDGMIEQLGGQATPSIGFAMGLERILMAMPEVATPPRLDAVVLMTHAELRTKAVVLSRALRNAGLRIESDLRGTSLKSQMRRADKLGARVALILGESELARDAVQWKDLAKAEQGEISIHEVADFVRARCAAP
ncbi:MAG: histidine--tRNA ligase [Polyangiales bacterium]